MPKKKYIVPPNLKGSPSRERHGGARSADGLTTRASLINFNRNCHPASPAGLHPPPFVCGAQFPLPSAPRMARGCDLAPQKCVAVYGRAQKVFSLIVMLSMQPCIETGRLCLRKRASGTVKVLSWVMASSAVFRGCSSQQTPEKYAQ